MPYFPQGVPDFNYLRHMLLLYGDARHPFTQEDLLPVIAHLDAAGAPDDWLFDSFLLLYPKSSRGNDFRADINLGTTMAGEGDFFAVCSPHPASADDWRELLAGYFGTGGALAMLDRTIESTREVLGRPPTHRHNVVLMIPYPHVTQSAFGTLSPDLRRLDFSIKRRNLMQASRQRLAASEWFVDQVVRQFRVARYRHLHLLGVYWMFETVYRSWDVDDHWVLKELRKHINALGLKFVWIPYWSSYNVHFLDDYQSYYFDLAFLQPNYMFYAEGKTVLQAAAAAKKRNAGIEIEYYLELDEPIAVTAERHARFRTYLDGGIHFGYMTEAACAHFQGAG
jgi:hypothetical protein